MIVVAGSVPVRPDRREQAVAAVLEVAEKTRSEAGCISYRFSSDLADANLFLIFEEWETDEALRAHFETEHLKAFRQLMPGLVAGAPKIRRYVVSSVGPLG